MLAATAVQFHFQRFKLNLYTAVLHVDFERHTGPYSGLLPEILGKHEPSGRIHGSIHTWNYTMQATIETLSAH